MKKAFSSHKARLAVLVFTVAMFVLTAGAPGAIGGFR